MDAEMPDMAGGNDSRPVEGGPSLRRAAQLTALAGVIHAVLFLLSFWLITRTPGVSASDTDLVNFYMGPADRQQVLVGLYLMPFAGIAFLWFLDALRLWHRGFAHPDNLLFSNMQLFAGILFVALFFLTAAAFAVTAASVEFAKGPIDPLLARLFPEYGRTIFFFFALRMAAVFAFSTSKILLAAGVLPKWLGRIGFVVGVVLLLTPTFNDWLSLVFPAWVLVFCAAVYRAAGQHQDGDA